MGKRDLYIDALRALALVRVVAYHTLALWWLHLMFPAIGVMFGLAGSLMAASLAKRNSVAAVGLRLRRLLPPLWLYGLVAILAGWELVGRHGLDWTRLPFWLLPLRDPHDSPAGSGFVDTLWYLRTYVWFVLVSPLALPVFRRAPVILTIAPLLVLPAAAFAPGGLWTGRGELTSFLGYGTCWLLGFAHRDGMLRQLPARICWLVAGAAAAGGLALLVRFPLAASADSGREDVGYALWSAAVVLLLLRWQPDLAWIRRIGWLDRTLTVINARGVTIYLWHDAAVVAVTSLVARAGIDPPGLVQLVMVLALTAVVVFAAGWVEDLAAGRRPVLLPRSTSEGQRIQGGRHRAMTESRQRLPSGHSHS